MLKGGQEGRDYLCLWGSVKISWRQLFLNWALKDGYDLNKDKDIPSLESQEFEQKQGETEKYKPPQEKAHSSVWLKYGICIERR